VDLPDLLFAVVGVGALLASLLPRVLEGRPFSLPIVFVALGLLLGALPFLPVDASPAGHTSFVEHFTEVVVIISIMGAGLGLDRMIGWRRWRNTWRLLALAMPLTIVAIALLGWWALGLAPAAAALLGAVLAPTDPVLAGEVQVGEPASEPIDPDDAEDEVRFALTSEAGLNDALAFPFVYFALAMAEQGTQVANWIAQWLAVDPGLPGRVAGALPLDPAGGPAPTPRATGRRSHWWPRSRPGLRCSSSTSRPAAWTR
jgi:NhaP-type Na+/H+ or K+/H+ antiporter